MMKKDRPTCVNNLYNVVYFVEWWISAQCNYYYFAPGMGTEYCDEDVCLCSLSVCLSARDRSLSKTRWSNFTKYSVCMLILTVNLSSSDGVAIRRVLPVLWTM